MSLATLTTKDLSRIQKLIERKEALVQQITDINGALEAIESGASDSSSRSTSTNGNAAGSTSPTAAAPARSRKLGKRGKAGRGELKERISAELRSAGSQGIKVKDLAARLGTNYGNVTAFFQSTGKKMKEIKKVGPARFAWTGA